MYEENVLPFEVHKVVYMQHVTSFARGDDLNLQLVLDLLKDLELEKYRFREVLHLIRFAYSKHWEIVHEKQELEG